MPTPILPFSGRPRLLVSVRSPREALAAVHGGADIIDVKEPSRGSLGRAPAHVVAEIGQRLSEEPTYSGPLSAALGELTSLPAEPEFRQIARCVDWVKAGLSGLGKTNWQSRWHELRERLQLASPRTQLIAVAYADWQSCGAPSPEEILDAVLLAGVPGVLFDTYEKRGRTLLDHLPRRDLSDFVRELHAAGSFAAFAGSVGIPQLDDLLELHPDVIAVRSAVCRGDRNGDVAADLVGGFQKAVCGCRSAARG
jgi:uncharacterized protein (UPF0264 family)